MANAFRKTLNYLGFIADEQDYETPGRLFTVQEAQPQYNPNQILTVHPHQFKDAKQIAEAFRNDIPIVINLSQMTNEGARRLLDFCSGLVLGLQGTMEKITTKVFLITPHSIAITGELAENVHLDADGMPDTHLTGEHETL